MARWSRGQDTALSRQYRGFDSPTGHHSGGLAQLGERLPYKQDVGGSIPSTSIGSVV